MAGSHGALHDLEHLAAGDSPVHRLDARVKLLTLTGVAVMGVATPPGAWAAFCAYLLVLVTLAAVARLPAGQVLRRMVVEVPFLLTAAALPFVVPDGGVRGGTLALRITVGVLAMVVVERADGSIRSARQLAPFMSSPLLAAVPAGRRNGRSGVVQLSPGEVDVLLRRGRVDEGRRSHLLLVSAGAPGDAERLARALEGGAHENGKSGLVPVVTVLPPVASRAAAEAAARYETPVLVVLRAGETDGRAVAGMLELLTGAGAPVAGGVMLCRTTRDARIAWT